jgi:hypothetical protein
MAFHENMDMLGCVGSLGNEKNLTILEDVQIHVEVRERVAQCLQVPCTWCKVPILLRLAVEERM